MTYFEKEIAIAKKLRGTDYAPFGGNMEEGLAFFKRCLDDITGYVPFISQSHIREMTLSQKGGTAGEEMARLARQRGQKRAKAGTAIADLNWLSGELGLEPFADVDIRDPEAVERTVGQIWTDIYRDALLGKGLGREEG